MSTSKTLPLLGLKKISFQRSLIVAGAFVAALTLNFSMSEVAFAAGAAHGAHEELPAFGDFLLSKKVYWINFLIYAALLSYLLKNLFAKAWVNRRKAYQESISSGQSLLEKSERQLADARKQIAELPEEISKLENRLTKEVEFEARAIIEDASQRADKIKTQANQSAAAERQAAAARYQEQLVDLAIKRAISRIPGMMSAEVDSRLSNKVLSSVNGLLN